MLFGIDYARDWMQKKREKEARAYADGYNAAAAKCRQRQNGNSFAILDDANYQKGYEDGFSAGRSFVVSSARDEVVARNGDGSLR